MHASSQRYKGQPSPDASIPAASVSIEISEHALEAMYDRDRATLAHLSNFTAAEARLALATVMPDFALGLYLSEIGFVMSERSRWNRKPVQ